MLRTAFCLLFALAGLFLAAQAPAPAPPASPAKGAGDLMVMPNRIILEGRDRSAEVMLKNAGQLPASYRILLRDMVMTANGEVADRAKVPGERSLSDFLFFSPRQVDLAAGETQTVRLQIRKPGDLPDGEYRTHLLFQAIPPPVPAEPLGDDPGRKLSLSVTMVMGISIPVIVRHGPVKGKVTLSGLRYWQPDVKGAAPVLSFKMDREGNRSVRGDLTASVESGGKLKKGTVLYDLKNVVVYPEIPYRDVHMPMWQNLDGSLKGTRIKVTFQATEQKLPIETAYLDMAP